MAIDTEGSFIILHSHYHFQHLEDAFLQSGLHYSKQSEQLGAKLNGPTAVT